jgi:uncharacterized protein
MTTLLVIAKAPVPGRVKTRLCPPFTPEQAARLAEAALADTLETVLATPADRRILALDGAPGRWLPAGFTVVPQVSGTLDVRLAAAFASVEPGSGPALLVGMDTPQLTPEHLTPDWSGADAVLGPADDGGFWAIGFREPTVTLAAHALVDVPMSRADTGAAQGARLIALGLRTRRLVPLRDVDTAADAEAVARECPDRRFAACLAGIRTSYRSLTDSADAYRTGAARTGMSA